MTGTFTQLPDIRYTLLLHAPISRVWEAITTPEGLYTWFMRNDFQPKVGSEFTLHTPSGDSSCRVTKLAPPNHVAFTWGEDWIVSFHLEEVDGRTAFTLVHSGWEANKQMQAREPSSTTYDKMNEWWNTILLDHLQKYVET